MLKVLKALITRKSFYRLSKSSLQTLSRQPLIL